MTHHSAIESLEHLPLSSDLRLEGSAEPRWSRPIRLALFIGAGSLSWGVVIGIVYYAVDLAQRLF